jgi:N-acetylglucosaminyldiphosphoundecaprenol N-acetyl-beta-D-mannosaminyltransferase
MTNASPLPKPVPLLGLRVSPVTRTQLLHALGSWSQPGEVPRRMHYSNAHVFNLAAKDPDFRDLLNRADILICEGWGGKLASRIIGRQVLEQLPTMDWIDELLEVLAARRGTVQLIGDEDGVALRCGQAMEERHPGLRVVGTRNGFWELESEDERSVIESVRAAAPNVLMVGLGSPRQERWVEKNLDELGVPLVLSLGAMFRWYSGAEARAPLWMRRLHLEWLLRLIKHPFRNFRRYVIGNPEFVYRCLRERRRVA